MYINESSLTFFFQRFSVFYDMFRPHWLYSGKTPVYGIRPSFVTHRVPSNFCATLYTQDAFSESPTIFDIIRS